MELRRVEQELENLSSEWKALRRKCPRSDNHASSEGETIFLAVRMPSWKVLQSKVKDEEIFPPEVEESDDKITMEQDGADSNKIESITVVRNNNETGDADAAMYSDFGMCLTTSVNTGKSGESEEKSTVAGKSGGSVWERYAAKNTATATSKMAQSVKMEKKTSQSIDTDEEDGDTKLEDAPASEVLAELESLHNRFKALEPKIYKFLMKLNDRDPVTKKPRYGEKTMSRVKNVVRTYKTLEHGVAAAFRDTDTGPSVISSLHSQIKQHSEQLNDQIQAQQSQQQLEAERVAKEKALAEERANQQRLLEEQKKKDEEEELARRAEVARLRRIEEEQHALEAERRADQELMALVPTLGAEGVREQIGRMREALRDDRVALDKALGSLYTLFEQIVRKPEEINFRRVRRDHPKFMEDIGRHVGGREVLIAAGFKLEKLDGVPSLFSKEPHIESDMDGWSDWFDTLKKTLEVVEEEMLK